MGFLNNVVLPEFLANQRWFTGRGRSIAGVRIARHARLQGETGNWRFAIVEACFADGETQEYCLPLAIAWETATYDPLLSLLPHTLCRIRRGARVGVLYDATADPDFARTLAAKMERADIDEDEAGGRLEFSRTTLFPDHIVLDEAETQRLGKEHTNTSVILGGSMILKMYRRVEPGIHPEIEIGRFLTETVNFSNSPPLFGGLVFSVKDAPPVTLAMMQGFVRNQGDGWTFTLEHLGRFVDEVAVLPVGEREAAAVGLHGGFLSQIERLGERTAEAHRAFARNGRIGGFTPTPATARGCATLDTSNKAPSSLGVPNPPQGAKDDA